MRMNKMSIPKLSILNLTVFFLLWQHASVEAVLLELSSHHPDHYKSCCCWRNGEPSKSSKYELTFSFSEGKSHKSTQRKRYFTCFLEKSLLMWFSRTLSSR